MQTFTAIAFFILSSLSIAAAEADGFDYPFGPPNGQPRAPGTTQVAGAWLNVQDFRVNNHLGEDWNFGLGSDDLGLPVYASANGEVVYAQDVGGDGSWKGVIIILHTGTGFSLPAGGTLPQVKTMYAHLDPSKINQWVTVGSTVARGQQIGVIGPTPTGSTGPHLHFEIRTNLSTVVGPGYSSNPTGWVDPSDFIDANRPIPIGQTLTSGGTVYGTISTPSEVHTNYLTLTAGEPYYLVATDAGATYFYPYIALYRPDGSLVTSRSDSSVAVISGTAPVDGKYTLLVHDSSLSYTGTYSLTLTKVLGPQAADTDSGELTSGATVNGTINPLGDIDRFTVNLTAGEPYYLVATDAGATYFYPYIALYRPDGSLVTSRSDSSVAVISGTAPVDGKYILLVHDSSLNYTGTYSLTLTKRPFIVSQPQSRTVNPGANATFSVMAVGFTPLTYQWRFNGVNIPGATTTTLNLNSVSAGSAGNYSVIVSNPYGSVTSVNASLAVLADPANGTPSTPVATPDVPAKDTGQDSLIIITHGWQPAWRLVWNVDWIDDMADAIRQELVGQDNWQVRTFDWKEWAFWPEPEYPLLRATIVGNLVGRQIGNQTWKHVHLIGHSAGSALIQEAAYQIKRLSPTTTVHTTFLDPYFGWLRQMRGEYGRYADWSDTYYARDISGPLSSDVPHSHSVDVTSLAPIDILFNKVELHSWPYQFYTRTVTNGFTTTQGDRSLGYGFPLSMEGGGWTNRGNYVVGNTTDGLSGYLPIELPSNARPVINLAPPSLSVNNFAVSTPATVQLVGGRFQFQNGVSLAPQFLQSPVLNKSALATQNLALISAPVLEPAWVSIGVTVTNLVNYMKFDAEFTSATGAQGLFCVYWGTNLLGELDERTSNAGLQSYQFLLPETYTDGQYTLGFRLDAYTTTPSSLNLTNVMTGYIGITNPPALAVAASTTNGPAQVTLTGALGFYSILQTSTDLINWTPIAALVNSSGVVQFTDTGATNQTRRFYRAVVP